LHKESADAFSKIKDLNPSDITALDQAHQGGDTMIFVNALSRIKILFWSLLLVIFVVQFSFAAGSGSIKGHVFDKATGEPLIGANLIIQNTSLGVAADVDGAFNLRYVPVGDWTLKVSYLGYKPLTLQVTITEDTVLEKEFRLEPQSLMGEEVVVTAQARGQQAAINQQLSSNTISNIVASDRIKELPDASAAESIGRLPGVSIDRYNGEATGIAIRGLAPKYNTVTVNGVALPATNNTDRSVDLSLISSNLLDGIEVKKANTADMDADALGGTIDLRLKEAPEGFQVNGGAQGGYNNLMNYYGNYSGYLSVSDRFLDNSLGIIVGANADRNNRAADKLTATYLSSATNLVVDNVTVNQLTTRREEAFKNRLGGNFLLDYIIPYGKVTGNGFYNQAKTDGTYRQDQVDFQQNKRYYTLEQNISTTSIYTSGLGIAQDFGWIKYDASISATGSRTYDPNDWQWQFNLEANAENGVPKASMPLPDVHTLINTRDSLTFLANVYDNSTILNERTKAAQFNFEIPYKISDNISGSIKTGGKLRWITRYFDQEQWGRTGMQYGGFWTGVASDLTRQLSILYPNDFNYINDSVSIANAGNWILPRFYRGYTSPSNFLGGQYILGTMPDLHLMQELANVFPTLSSRNWQRLSIGSLGNDYDGVEQYQAAYIMTELNLGPYITFIPGVRYDKDYTRYHGQTFRAVNSSNSELPPVDYQLNQNERSNSFWLPQIHLKLHPLEWLRIHLAGTETVTRPDFSMYAPITTLDAYGNTLQGANGALKDSRSKNLDAALSIYEEHAGLITVSGFYKKIDNLIMYAGIPNVNRPLYKTLDSTLGINVNAPQTWFIDPSQPGVGSAPKINTWINNPSPAQYRGIELEWQTNFWYLPSVFKGLVFNLNWTYIASQIDLQQWKTYSETIYDPITDGFDTRSWTVQSSRRSRMPDQPAHIFNSTLGYDYKGFSIRVSYIYQSDKFTSAGETAVTDGYTGSYDRWDLAIQQKLTSNIQLYANFNNLTDTHDESLLGYREDNPQSLQYYGKTIDAGIRITF
jgi:TonB-dependent receptor